MLKNSICLLYNGHLIINRGQKANRGQCCQLSRQLCLSSCFQECVPRASARFPLRAQRISTFYLDSHFRNPLGTHCMPSAPDASKQTPALAHLVYNHTAQHSEAKPSKQRQLQPGERAETRSKAAARRIPSILQPPALSSSLRTAATLGMPAATPDQRTALLSGRVLHFCSCSKQSPRDNGASVCQQKKGPICESCCSWEEGWTIRDRLQAQPASMERAARVSEVCALGSGASQHADRALSGEKERPPASTYQLGGTKLQYPSSQPGRKLAAFLKLPSERGKWDGEEQLLFTVVTNKSRASPCGCERKSQASMGQRWCQENPPH